MDLQILRFFSVIAREGSILQAAHALGYAQPNLSTKMKQLEEELGTKLFSRTKQGVVLTEKGQVLLNYADKILQLAHEAKASVTGEALAPKTLCIGSMESAAITFLPRLLNQFHCQEPQIQVRVETCVPQVAVQKVLEQRIDGAIVAGEMNHPDLDCLALFDETLVLLTHHALKAIHDPKHLLSHPLLVLARGCTYRHVLETWLADEGIRAKPCIEFQSLGALLASVSAGLGLTLFPAATVSTFANGQALICHEIPEKYRTMPIYFISRKKNYRNVTLEKFQMLCTQMYSVPSGESSSCSEPNQRIHDSEIKNDTEYSYHISY